jgi:esterase/lipase superfamily enzyme
MPTPNVYVGAEQAKIYQDVPAELQSNKVDLLYVTDRRPQKNDNEELFYGFGRSPSLAFGSAVVEIGKNTSWEELVELSLARERTRSTKLRMGRIKELGRFPNVPFPAALVDGVIRRDPASIEAARETETQLHAELGRRLLLAPKAEAVVFIHGYNNDFDDAAFTLAELWHFLGREHVPILYTWPAGHGGPGGYAYDRESGEFTIFHLKNFLKSLAALPELDKVHVVAHSRGADVAVTALRELFLEALAEGDDPRQRFRIRNLILAAPDVDFEVLLQRVVAEHLESGLGQVTIYTSQNDKAIHIAERLFGSVARMGRLQPTNFSPEQAASLKKVSDITFIELQGKSDPVGHGYFHSSPAASSDLILSIRFEMQPGAEHGRPMLPRGFNFWTIDETYPSSQPDD